MVAAAGADLTTFAAEAEQADPDSLDAKIEELEIRIATHEEELRRLDQTIGAERGELERMDGSDRAAETAEKSQTLLARLQGDVARYATLKLASAVMNRGIERYREKNQGPILARAGVLFAGHQTCDVGHVHHEQGADLLADLLLAYGQRGFHRGAADVQVAAVLVGAWHAQHRADGLAVEQ